MASHNVKNAQKAGSATKEKKKMSPQESGRIGGLMGGRPVIWKDQRELETKIEECQKWCLENNKPFTLARLAVFIGIHRETILNYSKKDPFFDVIQKARMISCADTEDILLSGKAQVGAIFSLKNNHGYKDVKDVNVNETVTISSIVGQVMNAPIDSIEGNIIEDEEALLLDE